MSELAHEYGRAGAVTVTVPVSQVDLARRWSISPSSVQNLLRRSEDAGLIVSRSPLVIDVTTLDAGVQSETCSSATQSGTPSEVRPLDPPPEALRTDTSTNLTAELIDLLIRASAEGNGRLVSALRSAVLDLTASHSRVEQTVQRGAENADPRTAKSAKNADPRIPNRGNNQNLERELPSRSPSSSTKESAFSAEIRDQVDDDSVIRVVDKITRGKRAALGRRSTPAWRRPTWSGELLEACDQQAIRMTWRDAGFDESLDDDVITALRMWPAAAACEAIRTLSAHRCDTERPQGRLLAAAVWGYHLFFPLNPSQAISRVDTETHWVTSLETFAGDLEALRGLLVGQLSTGDRAKGARLACDAIKADMITLEQLDLRDPTAIEMVEAELSQ